MMSAFFAQLAHDVSQWTSSTINSLSTNPDNDEKESKNNNEICNDQIMNDNSNQRNEPKSTSIVLSDLMTTAKNESMLTRLFHPQHREAGKLWNQLCHKIDISYPPKHALSPIDTKSQQNQQLMNELRYSMRCAFCAYPPAIVAMKSEHLSLTFKTPKQLLKTCLNITDDDIIIDNCSLNDIKNLWFKSHAPCFYLIIDHNTQRIVLSIRGTASIGDIITDLNANCKKIDDKNNIGLNINGFVHEGMLDAAIAVRERVTSKLIEICNKYQDYTMLITGHSLGAGIASLLGLMYNNHPIIHKQNRLRVYSFASPCIVSKEITNIAIGNDYINSVVLGMDIVTRLSVEAVRKCNLRQDLIMNYSKDMVLQCLQRDDDMHHDESADAEFLRILKELQSPTPQQQLFPLGRVLWFVPNVVMNEDVNFRKRSLMNLKGILKDDEKKTDEIKKEEMVQIEDVLMREGFEDDNNGKDKGLKKKEMNKFENVWNSTWKKVGDGMKQFKQSMDLDMIDMRMNNGISGRHVFREFCHDISKGFKDIKTDIKCKLDVNKRRMKHNGNNWTLCDATKCRYIFQELVFDLPDCFNIHEPERYLWALDATITDQ